jgi:enoyl-CoA hydratase
MPKVVYEKDGRIGRITLNRPEVMNAIDDDVPIELADCVARANADPGVHVIILSGAGRAFCAGYDLAYYAEASGRAGVTQPMPWDPMKDCAFMMRNTELFMSLWRSYRPVVCKVHEPRRRALCPRLQRKAALPGSRVLGCVSPAANARR